MATQTIQFSFLTGQTVTVKLFADDGSDTVLATPTATESTNRTGVYTFTQTDRAAGNYLITVSATGINAEYSLPLTLDTATFWAIERSNVTHIAGTAQTARDIGASVLLSNGTGTGQVKLASGYVSPNWGDVANPTTAVGLTGTTISSSQSVASVSGAVGSVAGGVTVTTNNDKTGYSLSQAFPTNFSSLAITGGGAVTAGTVSDKTGYSLTQAFPTNFSSLAISGSGEVTAGTVSDKTGYSLSQAFPTNFSSLAITGGGAVTAGTVSDKTGYSLSQSFPTNFASMAITVGGAVTAGTVSDKTGYSLATAPLDAAGVRAAVGLASANLDTQLGTLATASALSALVTTVGVAGVGLTEAGGTGDQFSAIPWNAAWDTEVQSECTDALNAYDPPTKAEQDAAFTDIKGAGWSSGTDTLEKIRDASGGGGGSTVQINPIAIHTGAPAEAPLMTCHQGEYGNKAYLFYDIDEYGQRSATDFSSYTDLRIGVALPDGTVWIETADITVSANQLTIPIGDLTGDVGTFDATLWDWAGAGATDQRLVVACMQLVVTDAVGADEVVA